MRDRAEDRTPDTGHALRAVMVMSALQAAAALGVSERTIRRAIARGELRAAKHAGVFQIAPDDLARYGTLRGGPISLPIPLRPDPARLIQLPGRSAPRAFHVPRSLTPLIGRDQELGNLRERLLDDGIQLVTLTGPGGVGKTRLALEAGTTLRDSFAGGVWFIDLLPVTDPAHVPGAIARALGIQDSGGRSLSNRLVTFLKRRRQALLILDNVERITAAAPLIVTLLCACRELKVLVTSRVSLRVSGEHQCAIPPLECPDAKSSLSIDEVARSGAVRLFVMRAEAVRQDFQLTDTNMAAVAAICRRLDGLPLAIELAAARAKYLNPSAMLARLDRRLELLTDGPRDHPPRLRSMRDAVAWSYDLLTPGERRLFRRLSIFVGGFTLDAAVAVCEEGVPGVGKQCRDGAPAPTPGAPMLSSTVLDSVISLVDKSLVEVSKASGDEPRFVLLETLREFGMEQLEASGELKVIRQRHVSWCLTLVEAVEAERIGLVPSTGTDRLGPNRDNVRAALQWLREQGEVSAGLRLASALWPLWLERGEVSEGRALLSALLSLPGASADKPVWARALCVTGCLAQALGDHDQAADLSRQALAIFQHLGDVRGEAFALNTLGLDAMSQGDYAESERLLRESLSRFRMVGDPRAGAWALRHLSSLAYRHGDVARAATLASEGLSVVQHTANRLYIARLLLNVSLMAVVQLDLERAWTLSQEALVLFREEGDRWGEAYALIRLGRVAYERGDLAQASACMDASLALLQDVGDGEGTAVVLVRLGWIQRALGDRSAAAKHFTAGLTLCRERHHPSGVAWALLGEAAMALDRGDFGAARAALEESLHIATELDDRLIIATIIEWSSRFTTPGTASVTARVLGAASALRERIGTPLGAPLLADHTHIVHGLRSRLGETSYDAAFAEGRCLPLDEAIALSADLLGSTSSTSDASSLVPSSSLELAPDRHLTPREREVLRLLAEGMPDREIARALSISPRTVGGHVTHLLAKLEVETRTAAVAHALRNGLA